MLAPIGLIALFLAVNIRHASLDHNLIEAVKANQSKRVAYLLQQGADPNVSGAGNMLLRKLRIAFGGSNSSGNHEAAPLELAISNRAIDRNIATSLIQYGANVNIVNSNHQNLIGVLEQGYQRSDQDLLLMLLKKGVAPPGGTTSLLLSAVGRNDTTIAEYAIRQGADVNSQSRHAVRPIISATLSGFAVSVKLLFEHGVAPNVVDTFGNTALLYACAAEFDATEERNGERAEIVDALVRHGANVRARDRHGNDPAELAKRYHPDLLRLLVPRVSLAK